MILTERSDRFNRFTFDKCKKASFLQKKHAFVYEYYLVFQGQHVHFEEKPLQYVYFKVFWSFPRNLRKLPSKSELLKVLERLWRLWNSSRSIVFDSAVISIMFIVFKKDKSKIDE